MVKNLFEKIYGETKADVVFTSQDDLRFYLTGFSSSFGYVLIDKKQVIFYTDSRYLEAAQKALSPQGISVREYPRGVSLCDILEGYESVGIPLNRTYATDYNKLKSSGFTLVDSMPAFSRAMSVKTESELENIALACKAADQAFLDLLPQIKEGMTENELAALLEYRMRMHGASGTSFDTICAFGANSSVPHHATGDTDLKFGDVVLIDFGCKVNGYCSDCTRTFLFGDDGKHEQFKEAYGRVLGAHLAAKEKITDGVTGRQADAFARDYLKEYSLDGYFTHSLGHGIGVNIHEFPSVSPVSDDILCNGMVFSDEPGVYFCGDFGIRIEDTVTLKDGKVISLTDTDRRLRIL